MSNPVQQAVEAAARNSRAQLLAYLAARAGGDLAGAEDALSDAFAAALQQWPEQGVPEKPEAWLLQTARRRLIDNQRRHRLHSEKMDAVQAAATAAQAVVDAGHDFPDERLKLLFVCAHPAIDEASRTPLMLQTVLGLDAARIASAFLASPTNMSQRLVRAKAKIRDAGIPFAVPPPQEWPERISCVLDAIYAAFTTGWNDAGADSTGLIEEAIWLARVLVQLLPEEPEALGLLALLLHCHARTAARLQSESYQPLDEQDASLWDRAMISEAEATLERAARLQRLGRFQIEAAIQSVHAHRLLGGATNWSAIVQLYRLLLRHTSALGARLGCAIAIGQCHGPDAGLAELEKLPVETLRNHQPYWATRAFFLRAAERTDEARSAYARAIGLTSDAKVRTFLQASCPPPSIQTTEAIIDLEAKNAGSQ